MSKIYSTFPSFFWLLARLEDFSILHGLRHLGWKISVGRIPTWVNLLSFMIFGSLPTGGRGRYILGSRGCMGQLIV